MAIEKVRSRKLEMTPKAIAEAAAGVVLGILAIVFLLLGVGRWRLNRSITSALEHHDSNKRGVVAEECRSALARDEGYHPARQLLARVLVDEPGRLAQAEQEYLELEKLGYKEPNLYVGLGVIHLLRADAATDAKQVTEHVGKAKAAFAKATGCVESEIGLAHCKLMLAAHPATNQGNFSECRADFEKIRVKVERPQSGDKIITREGLLDLYAGLGRAAAGEGRMKEAWRHYRTALTYDRYNLSILGSLASVDAAIFIVEPPTYEELESKQEIRAFSALLQSMSARAEAESLREPAFTRELSIAYAHGVNENMGYLTDRIQRMGGSRWDVQSVQTEAWVRGWLKILAKKDVQPHQRAGHSIQAAGSMKVLLDHERMKNPGPERLSALVNAAVLYADAAVCARAAHHFDDAQKYLDEALKIDRTYYRANRNYAVLLKWKAKGESTQEAKKVLSDKAKVYTDVARGSAGSDGAKIRDLDAIDAWNP